MLIIRKGIWDSGISSSIINIIISIIICIIGWYIMIDDDSVIWKSPSSSSTPPHHHHHHEGVSVYSKHNSTTSTSTTFTTTSAGSSNKSYDKSSSSSWALKSPPVLSRLQLYREAWNDLIYYDNNNEDNILHDGSLSSSITTDDDDVNKSNDILLTVSEFNDGIGLRVIKDVPPHSSLGRINSKLIISIDHPIAQAYINEHKPDDDEEEEDGDNIMDSMIAAVICSIVYERKLDDKSIHRPLWRVIGVGDLPDTSWVEQRGLFGNDNNNGDDDHLISYIANGTTMEGWYEKGNDICYKAYKWLLTTNNEDVRNILPIIENGEETSIENIVSHILESTSSSTSSSTTSSGTDDDDDTVNGGGSTIVDNTMLTINDVKWAYILLKGYGLWFDNEDGTPPMLVTPLVFARPHYRSRKIINYDIKYHKSRKDNVYNDDNTAVDEYDNDDVTYEEYGINKHHRRRPRPRRASSLSRPREFNIEYIDLRIDDGAALLGGEEVFFPAYDVLSNAYAYSYRAMWLHKNNSRMPIITKVKPIYNNTSYILINEGCPVIYRDNVRRDGGDGGDGFINMKFWISRDEGELVIDDKLLPCYRLYSLLYYGLPYKLELYAVNMIFSSVKDNNIKRMIESSKMLLSNDDVVDIGMIDVGGMNNISYNNNILKDKSLLDIPAMEVREVEGGLLIQFITALKDYITIIDNVYVDSY